MEWCHITFYYYYQYRPVMRSKYPSNLNLMRRDHDLMSFVGIMSQVIQLCKTNLSMHTAHASRRHIAIVFINKITWCFLCRYLYDPEMTPKATSVIDPIGKGISFKHILENWTNWKVIRTTENPQRWAEVAEALLTFASEDPKIVIFWMINTYIPLGFMTFDVCGIWYITMKWMRVIILFHCVHPTWVNIQI